MSTDLLSCVEVDPLKAPTAAVIWLHGIGADGYDLEPVVAQLRLPESLPVRFVFPHAPKRDITLHGGIPSRAWFDILDNQWPRTSESINPDHIEESTRQASALIRREIDSGIPPERIVLAGFSQGGVIALHAGLRFPSRLAGIMALSTYLPAPDPLEAERSDASREIPILMAHGTVDPTVPLESAVATRERLTGLGYPVEWHEYRMVHTICVDEIMAMRSWLLNVLPQ